MIMDIKSNAGYSVFIMASDININISTSTFCGTVLFDIIQISIIGSHYMNIVCTLREMDTFVNNTSLLAVAVRLY